MASMLTEDQYHAYKAAHHAVGKTKQIVLLYDEVIRLVSQAIDAIERHDIQTRYTLIEKANKIILGLQGALDFNQGGEISKLLDEFYFSIDYRLIKIQGNDDLKLCKTLITELKMMRDAWIEVDQTVTDPTSSPIKTDDASGDESNETSIPSSVEISV